MSLLTLEHSKVAYRLDLAVFGAASVGLGTLLFLAGPPARLIQSIACAALGLASWSFMEYGLHRFVLHGMRPFSTRHAKHHQRPAARILLTNSHQRDSHRRIDLFAGMDRLGTVACMRVDFRCRSWRFRLCDHAPRGPPLGR